MDPGYTFLQVAGLTAAPIAALLYGRATEPRARRSPGRFFLLYSVLYSILLMLTRYIGIHAAWLGAGVVLGMLGSGKGVVSLYRMLYGREWLSENPEAPAIDSTRWHLPTMIGAVLCIAVALFIAFLPS